MTALEFLLKDLGWSQSRDGKHWWSEDAMHIIHVDDLHTYEFISGIKIKDERKYWHQLLILLGAKGEDMLSDAIYDHAIAIHNASLDHRIEAHARERGWTG